MSENHLLQNQQYYNINSLDESYDMSQDQITVGTDQVNMPVFSQKDQTVQYAPVGAAGRSSLKEVCSLLSDTIRNRPELYGSEISIDDLRASYAEKLDALNAYTESYRRRNKFTQENSKETLSHEEY